MTVRFLSDEWIALVQERLNGSDAFRAAASSVSATVQQVVPAPDGERRYWIRLDGGSVTVGPGDASEPDVTITQDLATATAMAKRELNPVTAFVTGRLRVAGNTGLLMRLQGAISQLPDLMADVEVEY